MSQRFDGQCAIVTGGASGLGLGIARRLASEGAAVCLWDRNAQSLSAANANPRAQVEVDIVDPRAVEAAAESTVKALGGLHVLVCSAGISGGNARLWEYPVEEWRRIIDVNLNGMFHCCRSAVPPCWRADTAGS